MPGMSNASVIEIARAGPYRGGGELTVTQLESIVEKYDPSKPAPVFIGHPEQAEKTEAEGVEVGKVRQLYFRPESATLMAAVEVRDEIRALNQDGLYEKCSMSFMPRSLRFNHLALLNEVPPCVSGLKRINLAALNYTGDDSAAEGEEAERPLSLSFNFDRRPAPAAKQETTPMPEATEKEKPTELSAADLQKKDADLTAREEKLLQTEAVNLADALVAAKKLPPAMRDHAAALYMSLPSQDNQERPVLCAMDGAPNPRFSLSFYGNAEAKTPREAFRLMMEGMPENLAFAASKTGEKEPEKPVLCADTAAAMISEYAEKTGMSLESARNSLAAQGKL